jgi:hypothetical protein
MTRLDLLKIVVGRARSNGFELRRWYTARLGLPWTSTEDALTTIEKHRHYYALLFSHEFALAFWKPGEEITFQIPAHTFQRRAPDGSIQTVTRKPFIRRSARKDAWRYHLREMALAEEPLRYIRRYLHVEEELTDDTLSPDEPTPDSTKPTSKKFPPKPNRKPAAKSSRDLPQELPAFLRRPYP